MDEPIKAARHEMDNESRSERLFINAEANGDSKIVNVQGFKWTVHVWGVFGATVTTKVKAGKGNDATFFSLASPLQAAGLVEGPYPVREVQVSISAFEEEVHTDLVVDASINTRVSSASYTFVNGDIGKIVRVTGGTGWTPGDYRIVGVTGGAADLDASPAATATADGEWELVGQVNVELYGERHR